MTTDTKPVNELIERLHADKDEVENLLVVYDLKVPNTDLVQFCIGMSHGTNLSWFLKAKEWVTWVLYSMMTGFYISTARQATEDRAYLEAAALPPGDKPS